MKDRISRKILLLHAHPAPHKSRANRAVLEAARSMDGVQVRELYELYPDFLIDVPVEQALLEEHDVVVLQHPMYWYSAPALVKEWMDLVLAHGWAYGEGGTALEGKIFLQSVTSGGATSDYHADGRHGRGVRDFLLPFEQSVGLCRMRWLAPFVIHGAGALDSDGLAGHVQDFLDLLAALRDDRCPINEAAKPAWINRDLRPYISPPGGDR